MNRITKTVFVASLLTAVAVAPVFAPDAIAQDKMGTKMSGKMDSHQAGVSVCEKCKVYMPSAAAQKMGGKDAMGHMMTKADKAPMGFMDASKGKMKSKTKRDSKMKMSGPVYACPECKTFMGAKDAEKMGGKDAMGHMMKKMDKAPAGYTDASKRNMGGKM